MANAFEAQALAALPELYRSQWLLLPQFHIVDPDESSYRRGDAVAIRVFLSPRGRGRDPR